MIGWVVFCMVDAAAAGAVGGWIARDILSVHRRYEREQHNAQQVSCRCTHDARTTLAENYRQIEGAVK